MKKSTPTFDELIQRFHESIQLKHPDVPVDTNCIEILKDAWRGKEAQLYRKVKQMENDEVKFNNLKKRIDHRTVEFQVGVSILGEPQIFVHEVVFQTDVDRKYKKGTPNQILLKSRGYYAN